MKTSRPILTLLCILSISCASWTPAQRSAFIGDITALASVAAGLYGGPAAAAGLNALGSVLQAYVGRTVPAKVVTAAPGVGTLGATVAPLISTTAPVTQADATAIFSAAKEAASK